MTSPLQPVELVVEEAFDGVRLDVFLAQKFSDYSRVHLRKVVNADAVQVNDRRSKASHKLRTGERVSIVLPELPRKAPQPEDIPLEILYEDEWLAAINKPAGMVVHPAKGHWKGTLTSALQFHFDKLSGAGGPTRPGIVHRLDRDTSGVLVVAKTDQAHYALSEQFEERSTEKEYFAITAGVPDRDRDIIDLPIGVHPYQREKMAIRRDHPTSRSAQTFYEVSERFDGFASLRSGAKNRPDTPDSCASGAPRLSGVVRQAVRRPRGSRARRDHARAGRPRDDSVAPGFARGTIGIGAPGDQGRARVLAPLPEDMHALLALLRNVGTARR